jgi:hypothetical protein
MSGNFTGGEGHGGPDRNSTGGQPPDSSGMTGVPTGSFTGSFTGALPSSSASDSAS